MIRRHHLIFALAAFAAAPLAAQAPPFAGLDTGTIAPGFSAAGANKDGVMKSRVSLADFKGKTVVLAFFYQARTKG